MMQANEKLTNIGIIKTTIIKRQSGESNESSQTAKVKIEQTSIMQAIEKIAYIIRTTAEMQKTS